MKKIQKLHLSKFIAIINNIYPSINSTHSANVHPFFPPLIVQVIYQTVLRTRDKRRTKQDKHLTDAAQLYIKRQVKQRGKQPGSPSLLMASHNFYNKYIIKISVLNLSCGYGNVRDTRTCLWFFVLSFCENWDGFKVTGFMFV